MKNRLNHVKKLNRTPSHRRSLIHNILSQLLEYERISTTKPKAQMLQHYADKLIALAKNGTRQDIDRTKKLLAQSERFLPKLFTHLAPRYAHTDGPYTRVIAKGTRGYGFKEADHAPMAYIELVDSPNSLTTCLAYKNIGQIKEKLDQCETNPQMIHPDRLAVIKRKGQLTTMYKSAQKTIRSYELARENEKNNEGIKKIIQERLTQEIAKLQKKVDDEKVDKELMKQLYTRGFVLKSGRIGIEKLAPVRDLVAEQKVTGDNLVEKENQEIKDLIAEDKENEGEKNDAFSFSSSMKSMFDKLKKVKNPRDSKEI